jgi:hypothetical protein
MRGNGAEIKAASSEGLRSGFSRGVFGWMKLGLTLKAQIKNQIK